MIQNSRVLKKSNGGLYYQDFGSAQKRTQFATQPDKYNRVHYFAIIAIGTPKNRCVGNGVKLMMMPQKENDFSNFRISYCQND